MGSREEGRTVEGLISRAWSSDDGRWTGAARLLHRGARYRALHRGREEPSILGKEYLAIVVAQSDMPQFS